MSIIGKFNQRKPNVQISCNSIITNTFSTTLYTGCNNCHLKKLNFKTLEYANFLNPPLASLGSRYSIIAVIPEGGKTTLPTVPCLENTSLSSSALVSAGRFLTNITVLLLAAAAYIHFFSLKS